MRCRVRCWIIRILFKSFLIKKRKEKLVVVNRLGQVVGKRDGHLL